VGVANVGVANVGVAFTEKEATCGVQGCQIYLDTIYQIREKYTKFPLNYQVSIKCTKWPENISNGQRIYQPFPFQGPPKFIQIGIFGLKI
jgi:hypothetical protein